MTLNTFYERDNIFEQDDLSIYLPLENSAQDQALEETNLKQNTNTNKNKNKKKSKNNNSDRFVYDNTFFLNNLSDIEQTENIMYEKQTETSLDNLWDEFQLTNDFPVTEEKPLFPLPNGNRQNDLFTFSGNLSQNCSNDEIQTGLFQPNSKSETNEKVITTYDKNNNNNHKSNNIDPLNKNQNENKKKNESKNKNQNENENENKNQNQNSDSGNTSIEETNLKRKQKQFKTKIIIQKTRKKKKRSIQKRISPRNTVKKKRIKSKKKILRKKANLRKRKYKNEEKNKNSIRKEIVGCGKEIYKLLTSEIWVMTGGANQKQLGEYTDFFANTIGKMLGANEKEITLFQSPTKYLLSNSRRTLTEYISELILGLLALNFYNNETQIPEKSKRLYSILRRISNQKFRNNNYTKKFLEKTNRKNRKQKHKQQNLATFFGSESNNKSNKNDHDNELINISDNDNFTEKYHHEISLIFFNNLKQKDLYELDQLFEQIFTEKVLLFWFKKRFINQFSSFMDLNQRRKFCSKYLLPLVKTRFLIICNLLAQNILLNKQNKNSLIYQYCKFIENNQDGDVFSVYNNNRKSKLKLIKELIVEFGLNDGQYWQALTNHSYFSNNGSFNVNSAFEQFPFKGILHNFKNHFLVVANANFPTNSFKHRKLMNKM
ncbi:hypothetical protein M0812_01051 [Anaeramoeba flamelloides]|uniref:Uncharacterized protein n=1 Tax=Anaeramoeba flamelloides TaxID=1746091 RepID=A0AAV8A990_9EUKA|nr:hypothetical protein M0812_01051 [Anaeramoeba flamelloides]